MNDISASQIKYLSGVGPEIWTQKTMENWYIMRDRPDIAEMIKDLDLRVKTIMHLTKEDYAKLAPLGVKFGPFLSLLRLRPQNLRE